MKGVKTIAVHVKASHRLQQGGRNMRKEIEKPNIVEVYRKGGSVVRIADNFIRSDPKEIDAILDAYHKVGWAIEMESQEKEVD